MALEGCGQDMWRLYIPGWLWVFVVAQSGGILMKSQIFAKLFVQHDILLISNYYAVQILL